MKLSFIKTIIVLLFLSTLSSFVFVDKAFANAPNMDGYVRAINTNTGIANVWVKWTDNENRVRYERTNSSGYYYFPSWQSGDGTNYTKASQFSYLGNDEIYRVSQYFTWIKPEDPNTATDSTGANKYITGISNNSIDYRDSFFYYPGRTSYTGNDTTDQNELNAWVSANPQWQRKAADQNGGIVSYAGFGCYQDPQTILAVKPTTTLGSFDTLTNVRINNTISNGTFDTIFYHPPLPVGNHDGYSGDQAASTCRAWGWASMPGMSTPVNVDIYIGGQAGTGAPGYRVLANGERGDGNNGHGFDFTLPASFHDGVNRQIYTYAINLDQYGTNPQLTQSPQTMRCLAPPAPTPPDQYTPPPPPPPACTTLWVGAPPNNALENTNLSITARVNTSSGVVSTGYVAMYLDNNLSSPIYPTSCDGTNCFWSINSGTVSSGYSQGHSLQYAIADDVAYAGQVPAGSRTLCTPIKGFTTLKAPPQPTNLIGRSSCDGLNDPRNHISWDKTSNTQSYNVYRDPNTGSEVYLGNTTNNFFADTSSSISNGSTHTYSVIALSSDGITSPESSALSVTATNCSARCNVSWSGVPTTSYTDLAMNTTINFADTTVGWANSSIYDENNTYIPLSSCTANKCTASFTPSSAGSHTYRFRVNDTAVYGNNGLPSTDCTVTASTTSKGNITGTVYIDKNSNGAYDASDVVYDQGVNGVNNVSLSGPSPAPQQYKTLSDGYFGFYSLPGSTFTVTLSVPSGYVATTTSSVSHAVYSNDVINFGIKPNCNAGISCSGSCNIACGTGGTQGSCTYTTYSGGGACNAIAAPDQSCNPGNTCTGNFTCQNGACVAPNCNATPTGCGACTVYCGGGTQSCTLTTYTGGGACIQTPTTQSCNTTSCPSVSCSAAPNPVLIGQNTTFTANASGGSGGYAYTWSTDVNGSGSTLTTNFGSTGTKTATIKVTSSGTSAYEATNSCTVAVNNPLNITSYVYKDVNGDGVKQSGEPLSTAPASDIYLWVFNGSWSVQAIQNTGTTGQTDFVNLTAGSYSPNLAAPSGYTYSGPGGFTVSVDQTTPHQDVYFGIKPYCTQTISCASGTCNYTTHPTGNACEPVAAPPPTCVKIERDSQGSNNIVSGTTVNIQNDTFIDLYLTMSYNKPTPPTNSWTVTGGSMTWPTAYTFNQFLAMGVTPGTYNLNIATDGVNQPQCQVTFNVTAPPPVPRQLWVYTWGDVNGNGMWNLAGNPPVDNYSGGYAISVNGLPSRVTGYNYTNIMSATTTDGSSWAGWGCDGGWGGTGCNSTTVTGNGFSGSALQASNTVPTHLQWALYGAQTEQFVAGKTYNISFKYRSNVGLYLNNRDDRIVTIPTANTGNAQFFDMQWTAPNYSGASCSLQSSCYLIIGLNGSGSPGWMEIDDLRVERIDTNASGYTKWDNIPDGTYSVNITIPTQNYLTSSSDPNYSPTTTLPAVVTVNSGNTAPSVWLGLSTRPIITSVSCEYSLSGGIYSTKVGINGFNFQANTNGTNFITSNSRTLAPSAQNVNGTQYNGWQSTTFSGIFSSPPLPPGVQTFTATDDYGRTATGTCNTGTPQPTISGRVTFYNSFPTIGYSGASISIINTTTSAVVATLTTDSNGNYSTTPGQLAFLGNYQAKLTVSNDYTILGPLGTGLVRDGTYHNAWWTINNIQTSASGRDFDIELARHTIAGKVYADFDGNASNLLPNGLSNTLDAGISDVTVTIRDNTNQVVATDITNSSGDYFIDPLPNYGLNYDVSLTLPDGYNAANSSYNVSSNTDSVVDFPVRPKPPGAELKAGVGTGAIVGSKLLSGLQPGLAGGSGIYNPLKVTVKGTISGSGSSNVATDYYSAFYEKSIPIQQSVDAIKTALADPANKDKGFILHYSTNGTVSDPDDDINQVFNPCSNKWEPIAAPPNGTTISCSGIGDLYNILPSTISLIGATPSVNWQVTFYKNLQSKNYYTATSVTDKTSGTNLMNSTSALGSAWDGWDTYLTDSYWQNVSFPGGTSTQGTVTGNGFNGTALRVTNTVPSNVAWAVWGAQSLPFYTGTTYKISFKYRSDVSLTLLARDWPIAYLPANTGDAQYYTFTWTAPNIDNNQPCWNYGGPNSCFIIFRLDAAGYLEFDNLSIVPVPAVNQERFLSNTATSNIMTTDVFLGNNWNGWDTYLLDGYWQSVWPGGISTQETITGNGFIGNALRVTNTVASHVAWAVSGAQTEQFLPGKTYRISFKYRTNVGVIMRNRDDTITTIPANTVNGGNAQSYTYTYTAPFGPGGTSCSNAGSCYLLFTLNGTASPGYFEMGELSVEKLK